MVSEKKLKENIKKLRAKISKEEDALDSKLSKDRKKLDELEDKLLDEKSKKQEIIRREQELARAKAEDFELPTKTKLLELFGLRLHYNVTKDESIEEYLKKFEKRDAVMLNSNNVLMVIAKTYRAKKILYDFYYEDDDVRKVPSLDWKTKNEPKARVSMIYCKWIMDVLSVLDAESWVEITTRDDYPTRFENIDFTFILAPRGE